MNDFDPNNMSRSARSKKQKIEPQFARKSSHQNNEHKGLRVFLIVLGLVILSSVPVYGFWANHKSPQQQVATSVSQKKTSTAKKQSSDVSSSSSTSESSAVSDSESSSSEATSTTDSAASSADVSSTAPSVASSAATNTAVLGASQTLYNFAVTHGMTTNQGIALNPGLTVSNYTQFAGRDLSIR